jgi:glutamate/tyrosine decarboxylase-like PLP-dependent enzyme
VVVRAAETLHASDEYVGLLLAGSTWPALAAFLLARWLTRRRQGQGLPPIGPVHWVRDTRRS